MQSARSGSLRVIFGVVLLDLLGFGILIPQLGVYGTTFNGSPFVVGLLLSVYSLMQLIFAPLLGWASDRYGRRPVLLYSLAGSLAGYLLFAFAQSLPLLFLARIIDGASGGNISTAQAYVADVTTPENRAKGMGMVGAAFGLGFVLGPAVGGVLGHWGGNLAIGLFAAALSGGNLVFAFFALPESRQPGAAGAHVPASLGTVLSVVRLPIIGLALILFFLFTTAFSQMEGTFSVFLITQHLQPGVGTAAGEALAHEASAKSAWLFSVVGVTSAVIQGGFIGRLRKRFGEPALVIAGTSLVALGLLSIPVAPSYAWLFAPMVLLAAGSGLNNPSLSSLVSQQAPEDRRGQTLGAYQAMGCVGRIAGPALGGLLFDVAPGLPYAVAGAMTLGCAALAAVLAGTLRRKDPQPLVP